MFGRRLLCACSLVACSATPGAAPPKAAPAQAAQHEHGAHGMHKEHGAHGMHKDFSDAEAFSTAFDDPARDAWQRPAEVIEHLRLEPGQLVVDLGAGTGYFVEALARAVGPSGQVLALDVEPKMVEFMQRRVHERKLPNVTPKLVAYDDPGLAPNSVARVLVVNTWHHIDAREAYAGKLAAALAPEGEIWIVDFTLDADHGPPKEFRLAPERVVGELQRGGLKAEVVTAEQLPKQYLVRAWRDR